MKIGRGTKVIFQGFTGRQATTNATESIAWGTNIVGGVTPGKDGIHLGLPVLPTVKEAMKELKPDATGIYVAAHQAAGAIQEAIEAEVPLIVAVAEHIPIHEIMRIHCMLKTQSKSRLVGANCPGIISAIGKCRIGFQPLPCFMPGRVGIVAKSGTLSYEAVASTTRAGLGQSLCIGMGGDVLAGTNFVDALKIFEHDEDTDGVVLIGEIGGRAEIDAAEWIRDYKQRVANPKPIAALIGGLYAPEGRIMGHAGAFTVPGDPSAEMKTKAFKDVGVQIVSHPAKFGDAMQTLLGSSGRAMTGSASTGSIPAQSRGIHTSCRPTLTRRSGNSLAGSGNKMQKRNLYIKEDQALNILRSRGINATPSTYTGLSPTPQGHISISIDRTTLSPCILASPPQISASFGSPGSTPDINRIKSYPFNYHKGYNMSHSTEIAKYLQLHNYDALPKLLGPLIDLWKEKEGFLLSVNYVERLGGLKVTGCNFGVDDAAFKAKRQLDILNLRDPNPNNEEEATEREAENHGIVYVKLEPDNKAHNIGTLVNGAGLAMNTVDALRVSGGLAANFLDTGGKATSETVKKSFQIILQDTRVKAIFVNIFGGLTLGDMIARGVLLAFTELELVVPVVVRIRGTNEEEGQRIIRDSGLPLYAFDDFEEACSKVIELAAASEC